MLFTAELKLEWIGRWCPKWYEILGLVVVLLVLLALLAIVCAKNGKAGDHRRQLWSIMRESL